MKHRDWLSQLARLLPQLAQAPVSYTVGTAHHLVDAVRQVLVAAGTSRTCDALWCRVLILDAALAVGALDELTRTFGREKTRENAINSHYEALITTSLYISLNKRNLVFVATISRAFVSFYSRKNKCKHNSLWMGESRAVYLQVVTAEMLNEVRVHNLSLELRLSIYNCAIFYILFSRCMRLEEVFIMTRVQKRRLTARFHNYCWNLN